MKIILALLLLFSAATYSQNNNKDLYIAFDKTIGLENTNLSYGKLFTEKYRTTQENHPYLKKNDFQTASVNYQKESFYNILLKYDVLEDELIITIPNDYGNRSLILEKAKVKGFTLDNKTFVNDITYGFLQVLYHINNTTLYKKNSKTKKKKLNKSYVYYKFIENNSYQLRINETNFEVKNKKDFIDLFPLQKKLITDFYKANRDIRKNNLDQFFLRLTTQLSKQTNQ
tara:strand:+ start:53 stop:736 length:684 start_codon:yes stop_codon:yes gene_type:complete